MPKRKKKVREVTKNTTLAKILKIKGAEKILARYRLPCLCCPMAQYEIESLKIGDVARMYRLNLEDLLKELNKI